jgi:hyperosmotically inducible periplasmic protein
MMKIPNSTSLLNLTLAGLLALPMAACEKRQEPGAAAPKSSVGAAVDDSVLTTKVKSALIADNEIAGTDVKVETHNGEVQLSGSVKNQAQMDRAVLIARGMDGVKDVKNNLTVKTETASAGSKIDDTVVTTKVKTALLADPDVRSADIGVVTRNGVVQLSGFVENEKQLNRAVEVARKVEGVQNVANQMSVKK